MARGYMGAGDIEKKYHGIDNFFKRHPEAKVVKKIGRPIRLAPSKRMEPFFDGNIIGVGESIGCVFPMLGEGIIPSLICCDLFLDVLDQARANLISSVIERRYFTLSVTTMTSTRL